MNILMIKIYNGSTLLFHFYKQKIKKNKKQTEKRLEKELMVLEKELNFSNENYPRYQSLKQDIEDIKRIKTEGIMFGSKAKWVEYGEKFKILF